MSEPSETLLTTGESVVPTPDRPAPRPRVAAAAKASPRVTVEVPASVNNVLLERLLAMAHQYRSEGKIQEAMAMYWNLAEDYPGTTQSNGAKELLMETAAKYAREGAPHMARSIYERLLRD